jgi:X-Pro dipeptidyl-peptidase C-terminal non-catalytic domain
VSVPFEQDQELSGFFRFEAWISIDQPDTDFVVTVAEVGPNGTVTPLSSDIMRARYRETLRSQKLVTTKEPLRYDFNHFTFASRLVRKGIRLELILAAANSIQNQKNFNSGGVIADETIADSRTCNGCALPRCQAAERTVCSRRSPRNSWYQPVMGTTRYRRKQLLALKAAGQRSSRSGRSTPVIRLAGDASRTAVLLQDSTGTEQLSPVRQGLTTVDLKSTIVHDLLSFLLIYVFAEHLVERTLIRHRFNVDAARGTPVGRRETGGKGGE